MTSIIYSLYLNGLLINRNREMKYPCITRNNNEIEMILFNEDTAIILNGIHKGKLHDVYPRFRSRYTNITHEYLSNTWGVVESKEHAEFIVELAKNHEIPIRTNHKDSAGNYFNFHFEGDELVLSFWKSVAACASNEEKQITIPLPPKTEVNEAGHNLVFAASECKEWPCVGDEVVTSIGGGVVKLLGDKLGHYLVDIGGVYNTFKIEALKKPKTPEETLRDDIEYLRMAVACDHFVDKLLTKYNITPKD